MSPPENPDALRAAAESQGLRLRGVEVGYYTRQKKRVPHCVISTRMSPKTKLQFMVLSRYSPFSTTKLMFTLIPSSFVHVRVCEGIQYVKQNILDKNGMKSAV